MNTEVDYAHDIPTSHWSQWGDHSNFNFLQGHYVWEHPGMSDLAHATRPSYWEIDCDADYALRSFATQYWIQDILSRHDELDEDLYATAQELYHVHNYNILDHPETMDLFISIAKEQGIHFDKDHKKETHSDNLSRLIADIPFDEWIQANFELYVLDLYIIALNEKLLSLIFSKGYTPDRESIKESIINAYKNGNDEEVDTYDQFFSPENNDVFDPVDPIRYRISYNENVYWLMLALYPSENLPSYFHDQMVFMNFIQDTVSHDVQEEKDIILAGKLLGDQPDEEAYAFAVSRHRSYWT